MATFTADLLANFEVQFAGQTENISKLRMFAEDISYSEMSYQAYEIEDGDDAVISLGPITTATAFLLSSDRTLSVYLNGSDDAIETNSIMLYGSSLTAVTLSNASGKTAKVSLLFLGS